MINFQTNINSWDESVLVGVVEHTNGAFDMDYDLVEDCFIMITDLDGNYLEDTGMSEEDYQAFDKKIQDIREEYGFIKKEGDEV